MSVALAPALATLCFIPGMAGMTKAIRPHGSIAESLRARPERVDFVAFDLGRNGSVEQRARRFVEGLEAKLREDANFKCEGIAHSLGGTVARYALANLQVNHPTRGRVPLSEVVNSLTLVGTPNHGTPLGSLARFAMPWNRASAQMRPKSAERYNDPQNRRYSPNPTGFRLFSYRLRPDGTVKCGTLGERMGLAVARKFFVKELARGNSDSVSSLQSQAIGVGQGDLNVCHSYFDHEYGLDPSPADFYEMQAYRLTHKLELYKARFPARWQAFRKMGVTDDPAPSANETTADGQDH